MSRQRGARLAVNLLVLLFPLANLGCAGGPAARPGVASRTPPHHAPAPSPSRASPAHLTASRAAWGLPRPLSRMVVLPLPDGLEVLGGLDEDGSSAASVLKIALPSGRVSFPGRLAAPTHDAAGALLGGTSFVFGGGEATSSGQVQSFSSSGSRVVGQLPRPRSDLAAATAGSEAVLAGGYDGSSPALTLLATADGTHFSTLGRLLTPVRYPAVAALGGFLYVIGGVWAGTATDAIQRVDLKTGSVTLSGRLPFPLSHATAFSLAGAIWVAGGRTSAGPVATVSRLDPATMAVTTAGQLPAPVSDAGSAVWEGTAYLIGGEGTQALTAAAVQLRPAA